MRFEEMTGVLAPTPEQRETKPIPIFQPNGVSDANWAVVSADTEFMSWLTGQPIFVRFEQIREYVAKIDRAAQPRPDIDAFNAEQRRERESLAPTDAQRIASLEAALIELRVRVVTLEAAQPRKPAKVTRIPRSNTQPPDAA
jgi:hypothetical protein